MPSDSPVPQPEGPEPAKSPEKGPAPEPKPEPVPVTPAPRKPPRPERQDAFSRYTIVLLLILTTAAFVPIMSLFVVPLLLAATFAAIFYPVYKWLYKKLWHRAFLASMVCCLLLVLCILIPGYILGHLVVRQMIGLYATAEPWVRDFLATWRENPLIRTFMESPLGQWLLTEVDWLPVGRQAASSAAGLATTILNRTYAGVFGVVVDLVIMLFILFYFFIDGERLLLRVRYLLPLKPEYKEMIFSRFLLISRATIKGTLIVGLVDGALSAVTLLIFGVDAWLFWGFVIAILSIIPLVGAGTVMIPAGIVQILLGRIWQGIGILIAYAVVIANADNVIRPRVVGSSAKMHDLLIFFSTLGGLSVFGFTGFIIGPLIASLFLTILDIYGVEFRDRLGRLDGNGTTGPVAK